MAEEEKEEDLEELLLRVGANPTAEAFLNLPVDIVFDILSRLPIKSLAVCRCVCKTWREIVHHFRFTTMHTIKAMAQQQPHIVLVHTVEHYLSGLEKNYIQRLEYGVFDNRVTVKRQIEYEPNFELVGSCNGLVCLTNYYDPIYICNPVLGEYVRLPRIKKLKSLGYFIVSGFGFDRVNNEYKVIRMCHYNEGESKYVGEIYTLGSGGWRELQNVPCMRLRRNYTQRQVFINGALHWQTKEDVQTPSEFIVAFDVSSESFRVITHPPVQYESHLGDFGGRLCLINHPSDDRCVVWVMKDYGSNTSWTIEYVILRNVPWYSNGKANFSSIMSIAKNGKILVVHDCKLTCYDPVTETFSEPWHGKIPSGVAGAIPHMESFVSLRDIVGTTNRKRGCGYALKVHWFLAFVIDVLSHKGGQLQNVEGRVVHTSLKSNAFSGL